MKKLKSKRLLGTALFILIMACLVGCGNSKEKEAEKAKAKEADAKAAELETMSGSLLSDAMKKIDELGYTATYTIANTSTKMNELLKDMNDEELSAYTVTEIKAKAYNLTAEVKIATEADLQSIKLTENLNAKLESGSAWIAAKHYGESTYPQGFELHYLVGKIAEEPVDENTWYLKSECTVTNEYGAETKMMCEAKVTGTTDAPEVISLDVY